MKLMNRIDTKFVTTLPVLEQLLQMAHDDYRIQQIGNERNLRYNTTYFDTPDYDMFQAHQAGHVNRQKLRFRTYVSSHLQFMEVKTKNNHGRTRKQRIEVDNMDIDDPVKRNFLGEHLHYDADTLMPTLRNEFDRVTLVNNAMTERLTIDTNLRFNNLQTGLNRELVNLVIIELKRDGLCPSPVLDMLRQLRVHPHGFSKYCMGLALTNQQLRINRFKPKLLDVARITRLTPLVHSAGALLVHSA